jgi:hypothetical protein
MRQASRDPDGEHERAVAVVAELFVPHATRSEFDPFDVSVSGAVEQMGGPLAGLMALLVRRAMASSSATSGVLRRTCIPSTTTSFAHP